MKTCLLPLFCLVGLYSCNHTSPESEKVAGMDITIDTVMIDTGEDFINLRFGIYRSGLSNDRRDDMAIFKYKL